MAKRKKRFKKRKKTFNFLRKELTEEERIVKKIREEARKEKGEREKQQLPNKIKEKWKGFIIGRKIERELRKRGTEKEKERKKIILPDDSFGD